MSVSRGREVVYAVYADIDQLKLCTVSAPTLAPAIAPAATLIAAIATATLTAAVPRHTRGASCHQLVPSHSLLSSSLFQHC
jgi:hypothetical protein